MTPLVGFTSGWPNVGADIISSYWPENDYPYTVKFAIIFEFIRKVHEATEATFGVGANLSYPRGLLILQGYGVSVGSLSPTLNVGAAKDPIAADEGSYTALLANWAATTGPRHLTFFDKAAHTHNLSRAGANYNLPLESYS